MDNARKYPIRSHLPERLPAEYNSMAPTHCSRSAGTLLFELYFAWKMDWDLVCIDPDRDDATNPRDLWST